ncbi:MAG: sensor histidine kinase, partial [Xenococcaceae cyanobacterium]
MQNHRLPRRFLLVVYLTAMVAIFGASVTFFYILFARSLNKQFDEQLLTLAQAAVPSLHLVKTKGRQGLEKNLSWCNFLSAQKKTLEWFDRDRQLLAREGASLLQVSSFENSSTKNLPKNFPLFQQQAGIRTVTIAVYADDTDENSPEKKNLQIEGYVRASQSTQKIETNLEQLRLKLGLGAIAALIFTSFGNLYLARQAFAPLAQNFQWREQFITNFSDHLRNLLTKISLAVELMLARRERFQATDSSKLVKIDAATRQMQRLVDDLLFLVRTDTVAIAPDRSKSDISVDEILNTLANNSESIARNKHITIKTHLPTGISIRGDAAQLHRLFSNLLENALKYTSENGTISFNLTRSKKFAVISIQDTGVGI